MNEADGPDGEDERPATPWHRLHVWQIQAVRDVVLVLLVIGLVQLGWVARAVTIPLLVGLGLAYLFEPLVSRVSTWHRRLSRVRVVSAILALVLLLAVVIGGTVSALVIPQARSLVANAPQYAERVLRFASSEDMPEAIRRYALEIREDLGILPPPAEEQAFSGDPPAATPAGDPPSTTAGDAETSAAPAAPEAPVEVPPAAVERDAMRSLVAAEVARQLAVREEGGEPSWLGHVTAGGKRLMGFLAGLVVDSFTLLFGVFLVGFFFVFFSVTYPHVRTTFHSFIPEARRGRTEELLRQMDIAVSGFVRGRLLTSLILGLVFAVGWSLVAVPHAILLGLAVGVLCLAPYVSMVGVPLAWLLVVLRVLGPGEASGLYVDADGAIAWWAVFLFPVLVYGVAQLLDDYVLTPLIQGKATNLSPAAIMVAVIAGGTLYGFYGMLLAIPVAACIRILISEIWMPRLRQWIEGESDDPLPGGAVEPPRKTH
ncbi:MAG: AI-2E family transporter [Planctomycetota bacterium]